MSNGGDGTDEVDTVDLEMSAEDERSVPVLLSEDMLTQLVKDSEEEQHDMEKHEEDGDKADVGKVEDTNEESVEIMLEFKNDGDKQQEHQKEKVLEEKDVGSSTGFEIPINLDYSSDSVLTGSQNTKLGENKPFIVKYGKEEKVDNELPTVMEDYDTQFNRDYDDPKDGHQEKPYDQAMSTENLQDEQILSDPDAGKSHRDEDKGRTELAEKKLSKEKEGQEDTNESIGHANGKDRKSEILRKAQHDQALNADVTLDHLENHEPETEAEITLNTVQRKRGKWVRLRIIRHLEILSRICLSNSSDLFQIPLKVCF